MKALSPVGSNVFCWRYWRNTSVAYLLLSFFTFVSDFLLSFSIAFYFFALVSLQFPLFFCFNFSCSQRIFLLLAIFVFVNEKHTGVRALKQTGSTDANQRKSRTGCLSFLNSPNDF